MAPLKRNALPVGSFGILAAWNVAGVCAQPYRKANTLTSGEASRKSRRQPPAFHNHLPTAGRIDFLVEPRGECG